MKKVFKGILCLSTLLVTSQVTASELDRNWSIGAGYYAFSLSNSDYSEADLDFSGVNLSAGYAFTNSFQLQGNYFSLEFDEVSELESTGFDLMAYGGTGLSRPGFKAYGGAGIFSDKWSISGVSESFSGIQFGGGLGYNWGPVALDLAIKLRQAEKYEDFMLMNGTYLAISTNLNLSYAF